VQENEGIETKPRRKRRSREQIAELVREFKDSELTRRKFSENRGIALSELQRSLKIVRRASEPQLMAVQIEAAERNERYPRLRPMISCSSPVALCHHLGSRSVEPETPQALDRAEVLLQG
jgi:hypothetical protein